MVVCQGKVIIAKGKPTWGFWYFNGRNEFVNHMSIPKIYAIDTEFSHLVFSTEKDKREWILKNFEMKRVTVEMDD